MRNPLEPIYDFARERLGNPLTLRRLLESQPDLRTDLDQPRKDVSVESVVKWHEWGRARSPHQFHNPPGELLGFRYSAEGYRSFHEVHEELVNFGSTESFEDWRCDIQCVSGLAASKSNLTRFTSLDELVETNSKEMISPVTEEQLRVNLAHDQIRIVNNAKTGDHLACYLWDRRLFLINGGGSHHFSAARYIAARLGVPVLLRAKLLIHSINPLSLESLLRRFDCFLIRDDLKASHQFNNAMMRFRATYLSHPMPAQYGEKRCIFLPKSEQRSVKVSSVLRNAGFFDIGAFLSGLILKQNSNLQTLSIPAQASERCQNG